LALICIMSVFEEEALIADAIRSCANTGINQVFVFDGAWSNFAGYIHSQDDTVPIAESESAIVVRPLFTWKSQAHKRTYMFHNCGASIGDHIVVLDADERFDEGVHFPSLGAEHYAVYARTVGPMEEGRLAYPKGDYSPDYNPFLRVFAYSPELVCAFSGGYWDGTERIKLQAVKALNSQRVSITERWDLRSDSRRKQKHKFLAEYMPKRAELVNEIVRTNKNRLPEDYRQELLQCALITQ